MRKVSCLILMFIMNIILVSCGSSKKSVSENDILQDEARLDDNVQGGENETVIIQSEPDCENSRAEEIRDSINTDAFYNALFVEPMEGVLDKHKDLLHSYQFIELPLESQYAPPELLAELEEILCESFNNPDCYAKMMEKFGTKEYLMSLDEIYELFPETCEYQKEITSIYHAYDYIESVDLFGDMSSCAGLYHFSPNGESELYVFCMQGGTSGNYYIVLAEYVDGEFVKVDSFDTRNNGFGSVIEYEGSYYYAFYQRNENLMIWDTIRLYRLEEGIRENNVQLHYFPGGYEWFELTENGDIIYNNTNTEETENHVNGWNEEVEAYAEQMREEFFADDREISQSYVERGAEQIGMTVYVGDEVKEADSRYIFFHADFTNTGFPIRMNKRLYNPDNNCCGIFLKSEFELCTQERELSIDSLKMEEFMVPENNELMQLWFKEIEGKVYTFQIFHLCDYHYLMNVLLVEGDQVHVLQRMMGVAQMQFEIEDGELFWVG